MKTLFSAVLFSACLLVPPLVGSRPAPAADDHLGRVDFPTTCSPAVQPLIEKGAALLHSFQYMQSEKNFHRGRSAGSQLRDGALGKGNGALSSALGFSG